MDRLALLPAFLLWPLARARQSSGSPGRNGGKALDRRVVPAVALVRHADQVQVDPELKDKLPGQFEQCRKTHLTTCALANTPIGSLLREAFPLNSPPLTQYLSPTSDQTWPPGGWPDPLLDPFTKTFASLACPEHALALRSRVPLGRGLCAMNLPSATLWLAGGNNRWN
jgi:hypothetical protein